MHNVFFKDTKSELSVDERGQLKQPIINAIIGPDNDTESGNNSLSFYQRLFIDFFRGCIYEKRINDPQEDNLHHRINSGGCKLMVQGASGILGIEDPFKLIDKLVIDKDKLSSTEEETRDKWKQKLNNLLTLQAEANIHFNDAISLPKEIQNKELSIADVKKIYGEMSPIEWLDDKLDQYKTCLIKYTREMTELLMDIYQVSAQKPGDKDPALTDLERYIQLISSALIGVPFWSCKLTSRYMIQQLVADINQIKEKIDMLLKIFMPK